MKKNKGFTIVELLAVIVILAVIALITTPMILNVIKNAKKGALKDSVYGLTQTANLYYASNDVIETEEFVCNETGCKSENNSLKYKGKIKSGRIKIYSDGKISICIENEKYAAIKLAQNSDVSINDGACNYTEEEYKIDKQIQLIEYNNMKEKYEKEIAGLKEQINTTSSDYEQQLITQQETYELQIAELNNQKNQLIQDYEQQIITQQEAYETQLSVLNVQIANLQTSLNQVTTELNNLKSIGTASSSDILTGKTALVKGSTVTGSIENLGDNWIWPNETSNGKMTLESYTYRDGTVVNDMIAAYPRAGYVTGKTKLVISDLSITNLKGITADQIAKGQKVLGLNGTYTSDATATASQILTTKTAYINGSKITGTMANNGALSSSLNAGSSYTIPAGYTSGGTVTANTLASQTSATATASDILSRKTAYVNGSKITGTSDILSVGSQSVHINETAGNFCGNNWLLDSGLSVGKYIVTNIMYFSPGIDSGCNMSIYTDKTDVTKLSQTTISGNTLIQTYSVNLKIARSTGYAMGRMSNCSTGKFGYIYGRSMWVKVSK